MPAPKDPGLPPERTALAWSRSALALLANGLLMLRAGTHAGHTMLAWIGAALLVAATVLIYVGRQRERQLLRTQPPFYVPRGAFIAITGLCLLACAAALWLIGRELVSS